MTKQNDNYEQHLRHISTARSIRNRSIPFLKGRPERSHQIGDEDIVDLRIALHTCASIEEFLCSV